MTKLFLLVTILFSISIYATSTKRICGEDGRNYDSYSAAANHNIDVLHLNYCGTRTQRDGMECVTNVTNDCNDGLECISNDDGTVLGICRHTGGNAGCPGLITPVCGYNGRTYDNECEANNYGHTAVAHEGACGEQDDSEICLVGINDCGTDGRFTCVVRPNEEPRACDPIMNEYNELVGCNIGICWENTRYECSDSSDCSNGQTCDENHECIENNNDNGNDNGTGNTGGCTFSSNNQLNVYFLFLIIGLFIVIRKKQYSSK